MRKFIALVTAFLFILSTGKVLAVTQGPDELTINSPENGAAISESYEINWVMKDNEISDPAYFIDVFNLACDQNGGSIGRVTNSGSQKDGDNYSYDWDLANSSIATLLRDQGNYCLRICGVFADGGSVYSLCDKKSFVYSSEQTGDNQPPEITDDRSSFNLSLNQVFNHQVEASDPDGDSLTFSFVNQVSFLSINSSTGAITGRPTEVGNLRIMVKVEDGKGGVDTKEYTLNIGTEATDDEVTFVFPEAGSVVSSSNNKIEWETKSGITVKSIVLSYSDDQTDWNELTRLDRDTGEYTWNIASVEAGEYYLRIQLTDNNNNLFEIISEAFEVDPEGGGSSTQITDLVPEEGSSIESLRPEISAKFLVPEGVNIDLEQVEFMLDDREDLTVCDATQSGITCTLAADLTQGAHKGFLKIVDSAGSTQVKEWSFTVGSTASDNNNILETFSGNILQLVVVILAVGFVLIALPWTLYVLLKRKRANSAKTQKVFPQDINLPPTGAAPAAPPGVAASVVPPAQPTEPVMAAQEIGTQQLASPVTPPVIPAETVDQTIAGPTADESSTAMPPILTDDALNVIEPNTANTAADSSVITPSDSQMVTPPSVPTMYAQDEIPDWMKDQTEGTERAQSDIATTKNTQDIVDKTQIAEGGKVYDPYGLALNPEESASHN